MNERLVKKTQDRTLGEKTDEPQDKNLEEDMSVTVGDTIHNHHYPPPQAPEPTEAQQQPVQGQLEHTSTPWISWLLGLMTLALFTLICLLIWMIASNNSSGSGDQTAPTPTAIFDVSGPTPEE